MGMGLRDENGEMYPLDFLATQGRGGKRNGRHARGESLKTSRRILNPGDAGRKKRAPKRTFKCYRACPSDPSRFVYGSRDRCNNSFLLFHATSDG